MLSYQHAYHVGGVADVFKHILLCNSLIYLHKKPKGVACFDAMAGRGFYGVDEEEVVKLQEFKDGFLQVWPGGGFGQSWFDLMDKLNPLKKLEIMAGSSGVMLGVGRPQDIVFLSEMHKGEADKLRGFLGQEAGKSEVGDGYARGKRRGGDEGEGGRAMLDALVRDRLGPILPRVDMAVRDGFEHLLREAPLHDRVLGLIDPSYERPEEYARVLEVMRALRKSASKAQIHVWYPVMADGRHEAMVRGLRALGWPSTYHLEVSLPKAKREYVATGHFVFGLPYNMVAETLAGANDLARWLGGEVLVNEVKAG
ncbi:MAG: hypothetical protein COY40_03880 [Alphaproteobacteria bacterium CG_4_10_14_0_8_um_filter_53_9]|nr:MAG: hypothetical protein COY40_03880 [Alphaproteobacteria bacterium CG_4_10_14_0_8_um_filter_53_9]